MLFRKFGFSGKVPTFRLQSDFPNRTSGKIPKVRSQSDFPVNCIACQTATELSVICRKIGLDPRSRQFTGKSVCDRTFGTLPEKQMNRLIDCFPRMAEKFF